MRIGLLRHFPVNYPMPSGWMTSADLHLWRQNYEAAGVTTRQAEMGQYSWDKCLSSDSERAYVTAKAIYMGPVITTPLLREVDLAIFAMGRLRIPYWAWRWLFRLAWGTGHHSQQAAREDLRRRVTALADRLESGKANTLLVSHAGIMAFLRRELVRRGFVGPRFRLADHARLYLFQKPEKL